ncbi:MAG TPA: hypothetical protein VFO25_08215 [Candidatus Eremiobacteraceae bacterium]|nr:hypothetical protein [Candidatus Eremiobacteraceae bacterium]
MKMRLIAFVFVALAVGAVAGSSNALAAAAPGPTPGVSYLTRFDGIVTIKGATRVHVAIRDVTIYAQRATVTIPTAGFTVVHVLAGRVSSVESGRSVERRHDAYWSVRVGARLEIRVSGETATIETIASQPVAP